MQIWDKFLLSDETTHKHKNPLLTTTSSVKHSGSVMCWASVAADGTGTLLFTDYFFAFRRDGVSTV